MHLVASIRLSVHPSVSALTLDRFLFDLHAKIQVSMSVRSAGRVRRTHTQRLKDDTKTITPITSETWDVIKI